MFFSLLLPTLSIYFFETGSLTWLPAYSLARLTRSLALGVYCFSPHVLGLQTHVIVPGFCVGARDLN